MKAHLLIMASTAIFWLCVGSSRSVAAISPVNSPAEISGATNINFDGYPDYTVANTLFQNQGVTLTRDDGEPLYISDWTGLGRSTTSPTNVLSSLWGPGDDKWVTHLNVLASPPVFAIGAYFGNDQGDPDFSVIRMSAFGLASNLLGSVEVTANQNTSVDQFIGLRSDVPIARVRFDNLTSSGTQSQSYAVVLDDLVFAAVPCPEPAQLSIGLYAGIDIRGTPGATYQVEFTTDLFAAPSTNWNVLTNIVLPTSPYFYLDRESAASHGGRFYRAVAQCP